LGFQNVYRVKKLISVKPVVYIKQKVGMSIMKTKLGTAAVIY